MNEIREIVSEYALLIMLYASVTTLIIIRMTTNIFKRRKKYMFLREETINLIFLKQKYDVSDNDLINELFSKNELLDKELKVLKKQYMNLSIIAFIVVILILFREYLKDLFKKTIG
jgi:hypothetical protein